MALYYAKEFSNLQDAMKYKVATGRNIHRFDNPTDEMPPVWYYLSIESNVDGETLPHVEIEQSFLFVEGRNPMACKIYRYIDEAVTPESTPPRGHNYRTGLTGGLYSDRKFVKGELQSVDWYADKAKTDLVVSVKIQYTRDPLGFAVERWTTRTWYREDGEPHPLVKKTPKEYDDLSQIDEGIRRRGNIVKILQKPMLGLLVMTSPGVSQISLVIEGRRFLSDYKVDFDNFRDVSNHHVLDRLANDTEYPWLDNMTPYGITIRQFLIQNLTLGGI